MKLDDDIATILADMDYMAERPAMFTKAELASRLKMAAAVIRDLQIIVGGAPDYGLDGMQPEGSA